jgi:hypothetical protein
MKFFFWLRFGGGMPNFILSRQERRASFLDPTLRAYNANKVGTAQLDLVRLAILIKLAEMLARHAISPSITESGHF